MMRNILISLVLLSSFAFADYTKEDRIADMVAMEGAMAQIQKGFLYNNNEMIQSGAKVLRNHALTLQPPRIGDTSLSREETYAFMFARKQQRKIDQHAAQLAMKFESGDKYQAMHHFTKILKQCTACHTKLRKW
jgi:hypothetical protein